MKYSLQLWRCEFVGPGSSEPCNRSLYTEVGAKPPKCPFPASSAATAWAELHGMQQMIPAGVYEFEQMELGDDIVEASDWFEQERA